MDEFRKLVDVLDEEIRSQERILEVLTKERVAIVELKQDQNDAIVLKKEQLLEAASQLEKRRTHLLALITGNTQNPKVAEAIGKCTVAAVRKQLQEKSRDLRSAGKRVRELNATNAQLLKQALGILSSTLSIMRSSPGTELPTYGGTGTLKGGDTDPAFARRRSLTTAA